MNLYRFRPIKGYLLTKSLVERISKAFSEGLKEIDVSLDLGLSRDKVKMGGEGVYIGSIKLSIEDLTNAVTRDDVIYYVDPTGGAIFPLSYFKDKSYYKLKYVGSLTAPTLEINGIHMHNIRGTTPWDDAKRKISYISPAEVR